LLITLCVIIVLCSGVTQLTLTVDPIKLWAAPTSRARIERDFFEQTFRPFYRYFSFNRIVGTIVVFKLKSILKLK
jgi:hypothetical protein